MLLAHNFEGARLPLIRKGERLNSIVFISVRIIRYSLSWSQEQ